MNIDEDVENKYLPLIRGIIDTKIACSEIEEDIYLKLINSNDISKIRQATLDKLESRIDKYDALTLKIIRQ